MSLPMTVWSWLKKQFSAHTVRSIVAVFLSLSLVTTGILWFNGVFRSRESEDHFTYLPNRSYVLAETDPPEPETLQELLHADEPEIDTLLRHPAIARELLQASVLTDIVDSRVALNNLRSLDRQLSERLTETPESLNMLDLAELRAYTGASLDWTGNEHDNTYRLLAATYDPVPSGAYMPGLVLVKMQEQQEELVTIKSATSRLLKVADRNLTTAIPANMNMKCVWQDPAEGLIHLVPSGAWLPQQGYKLYRIVNSTSTLIAEQLAAPQKGLNGTLGVAGADWIKELYLQADLTPAKLSTLGMDAAQFNALAYRTDITSPPVRVSGALDFEMMREALITIPSGLEQRIPETDLLLRQSIYVMGRQDNTMAGNAAIRSRIQQKFSVITPKTSPLISTVKNEPGADPNSELMQSILTARQQIATLSFVDDDFAEAAGFLFRDDLASLELPIGTKITYQVETPDGAKTAQSIETGTETSLSRPQGLIGYGIDGKVPLRWQQASSPAEKAILSGYWIERKLDGESSYSQINDEPIVISYLLDETGVYFESPVFFEDTVSNGRTATYRIRSLDVFGRTSEYSEPVSFLVEKVTPPNAPAIDPPDLSTNAAVSDAARQAIAANPGQLGIVLPIYTDSPDTVRFTIYRAVAHGARGFGPPEVLANLTYHNPLSDADPTFGVTSRDLPQNEPVTKNNAKQLVRTNYVKASPNLIYFDANVTEGYTYKYWVSAWDSWNNESAWSKSASAGVPSMIRPAVPGALSVSMLSRELPDFSQDPPGILQNELIAKKDLSVIMAGSAARTYTTDITTVKQADEEGISIGHFIPAAEKFSVIAMQYDNLPADKYIHLFVAVRGEDVLPDGTARIRWPAYSGDGLGGYSVYVPVFPLLPLEEMQQLSRAQLMELGNWRQLNDQPVTENQFLAGGLDSTPGSFALFLICLVPEGAQPGQPADGIANIGKLKDISSHFALMAEGGFVSINWPAPDDPQIKHYRVYRSEVASFKKPIDESALIWTLVGDHIKAPKYTERVEQTFAHYYYYKVTSVTPWGIESDIGSVERFRVPATKPPQTPTLLLPLSRKDGIQVNFSAVSHCDRYEIYRTEIPSLSEIQINSFMTAHEAVAAALFDTPSKKDSFFSGLISRSLKTPGTSISVNSPIRVIDKFKTMTTLNKTGIISNLSTLSNTSALTAYKQILDSYGPLALADYCDLSIEMLHMINWTKVGELPADEDTVETVDPATGLLKPLSIIDTTAVYGKLYLYTVQAWNDDNLGSGRPEPVEATTRRNAPFDPIDGLKSDSRIGQPSLSWNTAKMANLTWQQCREDTVGYIVYRSDTEDGEYLQASPLLLEPSWTDEQADRYAYNWYKVKVLDTGGYLSEFSEPLLIRRLYMPALETVIPTIERLPPETILPNISVKGKSFTVQTGKVLKISYDLTGTEPISVTLQAVNQIGVAAKGIVLDTTTRSISTGKDLPAGTYTITLKAVNAAGEDSTSFTLDVTPAPTTTPSLVPPTVKLDKSSYTVYYPESFTAKYTLQGTEPITLKLQVNKADGSLADGFSIDTTTRTINAGTLRPGQYTGILTASNSIGKSEARFTLSVVMRTAPVLVDLADNVIEINHSVFPVRETTVQFSASGTTPLTWSLQPIEKAILYNRQWIQPAPVPSEAKIDSSGKLTIRSSIAVGLYAFNVTVSNVVGSDFQTIILEVKTSLRTLSLIDPLPADSGYVFLSSTPGATPTPEATVTPAPQEIYKSDHMTCLNFILTQVELSRPAADPESQLTGRIGYAGTALLDLGYSEPIPVHIINGDIDQHNGSDRLRAGTVYLKEPHSLDKLGLTLVSMNITPQIEKLTVSGYMQKPEETANLAGDLHTLEFTDAKLRYGFIDIESDMPDIRYQRLLIRDIGQFRIRLDGAKTGSPDLFVLRNCKVAMKSHLETLNNEGLLFTPAGDLTFNQEGELSGTLATQTDQSLQLLVPGGTALRVADAALTFSYGSPDPTGHLKGKLVLPFEKAAVYSAQAVSPGALIGEHPLINEMDSLVQADTVDPGLKTVMHSGLLHFGTTVQINGLRLVPDDLTLMDSCSFAVIDIADWNGKGFMLESAYLTPTSIADRSLTADLQEVQAIAVVPTEVTVDLDREHALPKTGGSQTPNETEKPFWVGMVLKGGTLTLPPAFIQTSNGQPIVFNLAEGEMIYDLNGFNYQTFLYNPNGVPTQFGDELGGFQDVTVYDCLLDLYANRVNLEINAEVAVDLFLQNRVKVKLYTNKEDNADGPKGKFLCSVAPTKIEQGLAEGIDVIIDGGWLKPDGMHINGAFTVVSDEVSTSGPLAFTDMVVPANKKTINGLNAAGSQLAAAELDKPVNVDFQGFSMEIRAIDLAYRPRATEVPGSGSVWMILMGSTQLSENIPLSTATTDNLIVECPNQLGLPVVIYEASQSVLTANFDGCVDVSGVLVPELTESGAAARAGQRNASLGPVFVSSPVSSPGEGLVEFDTDELLLGFLGGLNTLDIDAVTRFGYDMNNNRCYFAVGLLPASDDGAINFGAGDVEDFTGMVVYNMVMGRNDQNQFAFPDDPGQIASYVKNLPVHTAPDSFFGAGIRGLLRISGFCEIRDLYFGFGSGPIVDASGGLWLPLDVPGMIAGEGFKKVGSVAITYNHPERYFSFSMTIDDIDIVVAKVGGSIGFEFSPHLFGVYLGYPETLAGNISFFRVGVGIGFRIDTEGESVIKAKIEFGVEEDMEILIVYLRGYLYAGADGAYYFGGEGGDRFVLELYLKGGIEGGIIVGGERYNIIGFYLDARGRLESRANDAWLLYCSCEVSYSLDLWLFSVEGSVSASFDTTVG